MTDTPGAMLTMRRTPSQTRSVQRVAMILDSARTLLRESGFTAVTTTAVAERASIPVGSVYQYFPNKKAIFVALYEDYLAEIRAVYERLEQPEYLQLGWREFFRRLFREVVRVEEQDRIEDELSRAFAAFADLREIDRRHGQATAGRLATLMRRLGSKWRRPRLERLAHFIYAVHGGVWVYRSEQQPPRRERLDWELHVIEAALEKCFEGR